MGGRTSQPYASGAWPRHHGRRGQFGPWPRSRPALYDACMDTLEALLAEQIAYYRARAAEYDEWWHRTGRFDRGAEDNAAWFADVRSLEAWLQARGPLGRTLELACGTGLWTERLLRQCTTLDAVDASEEVLAINRARCGAAPRHTKADLFAFTPEPATYDTVFFGFWLSHVPEDRFDEFWAMVRSALAPGGRALFVDSRFDATSTARDHTLRSPDDDVVTRRLNDGREFRVVKIFHEPARLATKLEAQGWRAEVGGTARYFLFGEARPA